MTAPLCPYCGAIAALVDGNVIYPYRHDLAHKKFWRCQICPDAYVGCHEGTETPLGRLADAKLRLAKSHAHAVFDPIWERKMVRDQISKHEARGKGYAWLAGQLGIDPKDCHIGMFDVETCMRTVIICRPFNRGHK